jgi:uncharacterized membrane protein YfcA
MVAYALVGLAAGILAGLFGIGGGILIVPGLVFLGGMSIRMAIGSSLGALLLPVGLLGAVVYWREGNLDVRAALLVAGGLFIGAYLGALLGAEFKPVVLTRLFAIVLVAVAVRLWFSV